jgi:hypothetical protein
VQNVQNVLTQVERLYPGYQRDLVALQKYLQMEKQEAADPLPQVQKPISEGEFFRSRTVSYIWPSCMALLGFMLVFYRE